MMPASTGPEVVRSKGDLQLGEALLLLQASVVFERLLGPLPLVLRPPVPPRPPKVSINRPAATQLPHGEDGQCTASQPVRVAAHLLLLGLSLFLCVDVGLHALLDELTLSSLLAFLGHVLDSKLLQLVQLHLRTRELETSWSQRQVGLHNAFQGEKRFF